MDDVVHVEVAWSTDPFTRPAALDWTRLGSVDAALLVESLDTSRGANIRTGEVEAGTATAKIADPSGNLDPSNVASVWAPNVLPRRRIRFVVDPNGADPEVVLWTGFIRNLPPKWRLAVQWTTITAAGLIWLLADTALPPSVLQAETNTTAPVACWPLTESSGRIAEDVVGVSDGTYLRDLAGGGAAILPHDQRPVNLFKLRNAEDMLGQRVSVTMPGSRTQTVSLWVRRVEDIVTDPVVWAQGAESAPTSSVNKATMLLSLGNTALGYTASVFVGDGTDEAFGYWYGGAMTDDRLLHHVVMTLDATPGTVNIYVDGQLLTQSPDFPLTAVDLEVLADAMAYAFIGYGLTSGISSEAITAHVGAVGYWDRVLTAAEVTTLYSAGVDAWAGDLTGARLNRILDLAGVDADDRDIDAGTQTCGPTTLAGANVMEYIRKIAATEGGPIGEDAEGRIFLRERVANNPTTVATFSDDPATDGGSPVADLDPDFSLDRVVNICNVTREAGGTQTATAPASATTYGPSSLSLDTLHQSPSGARSTAARQTIRNHDPRLVFPSVTADSIDTTAAVMTATDVGEAVEVFGRPPRGGAAIEQVSVVERVEHAFRGGESWAVTFGVAEHVVLPDFWWDEPGQGWDESVWVGP